MLNILIKKNLKSLFDYFMCICSNPSLHMHACTHAHMQRREERGERREERGEERREERGERRGV